MLSLSLKSGFLSSSWNKSQGSLFSFFSSRICKFTLVKEICLCLLERNAIFCHSLSKPASELANGSFDIKVDWDKDEIEKGSRWARCHKRTWWRWYLQRRTRSRWEIWRDSAGGGRLRLWEQDFSLFRPKNRFTTRLELSPSENLLSPRPARLTKVEAKYCWCWCENMGDSDHVLTFQCN